MQFVDAVLALLDGRHAEALGIIERSLDVARRRSPLDDWRTHDVLVRALARTGRVEEALAAAEKHRARRGNVHDLFVIAVIVLGLMEPRLLAGDPAGAVEVAAGIVPGLVEARQLVLLPGLALLAVQGSRCSGSPRRRRGPSASSLTTQQFAAPSSPRSGSCTPTTRRRQTGPCSTTASSTRRPQPVVT